jgi:hypothetical protein
MGRETKFLPLYPNTRQAPWRTQDVTTTDNNEESARTPATHRKKPSLYVSFSEQVRKKRQHNDPFFTEHVVGLGIYL